MDYIITTSHAPPQPPCQQPSLPPEVPCFITSSTRRI